MSELSPLRTGIDVGFLQNAARAVEADAKNAADDNRTEAAAESFNRLLSTMLIKEMRKSMPEGGFFQGAGADTYNSWFDEHLGAAMADADAFGLLGMVKASLRTEAGSGSGYESESEAETESVKPAADTSAVVKEEPKR